MLQISTLCFLNKSEWHSTLTKINLTTKHQTDILSFTMFHIRKISGANTSIPLACPMIPQRQKISQITETRELHT